MKRIIIILLLFAPILNSVSQQIVDVDEVKASDELYVRDSTILEIIEANAPSATARNAGMGLTLVGNDIDLGGTLDSAMTIAGAGYDATLGTSASNLGNLEINTSDDYILNVGGDWEITKDSRTWTLSNQYFINSTDGDTLATLAEVRSLIAANESVLPFNFDYQFSTSTTNSRPGVGYFRANNATLSLATRLYIDDYDVNSVDKTNFIQLADTGSVFYIETRPPDANYILYRVSGGFADSSGYTVYNVEHIANVGGNFLSNDETTTNVLEINNNTGQGGGGTDSTLVSFSDTLTLQGDSVLAVAIHGSYKSLSTKDTLYIDDNGHIIYELPDGDLAVESKDGNAIFLGDDDIGGTYVYSSSKVTIDGDVDVDIISNINTYSFINDTAEFEQEHVSAKSLSAEQINVDTIISGNDTTIGFIELQTAIEAETFDKITFNPTSQAYSEGKMFYDTNEYALTLYNDISAFKHQIGYEHVIRFYNNTGGTLTEGTIIRSIGAKVNGNITFLADLAGIGSRDSLNGIAMVTADVLTGNFGIATLIGQVNGLNTSVYSDNQVLYVSYSGTYDTINPNPPNISQIVGRVQYADADSGSIYFYGFSESSFSPIPQFSAYFNDSTATIDITVQNQYEQITNANNNLYIEDLNDGFQFQGDSIRPLQNGTYKVSYTYSFYGDAANNDNWNIGVFKNGIKEYKTLRTSSSTNRGGVPFFKIIELTTSDWLTLKVANTSSATRDCVFVDANIAIEYLTE